LACAMHDIDLFYDVRFHYGRENLTIVEDNQVCDFSMVHIRVNQPQKLI